MKIFSSLFAKILLWLFINLVLVALVLIVFFSFQSHSDWQSFLGRQASDRMRIAGRLIAHDLHQTPKDHWPRVLARHGEICQVDFIVLFMDGSKVESKNIPVSEAVMKTVADAFGPQRMLGGFPMPPGFHGSETHDKEPFMRSADGIADRKPENGEFGELRGRPGKIPRLMMRTKNPTRYWAGIPIPVSGEPSSPLVPAMLLAVSDSITGNGFFSIPLRG